MLLLIGSLLVVPSLLGATPRGATLGLRRSCRTTRRGTQNTLMVHYVLYATEGQYVHGEERNKLPHRIARQRNHHDIGCTMVLETTTNPLTIVTCNNIGL